jgi:hypothetical protein
VIPRVCYFYWGGGPLPWLRAQSMATFATRHPEWRVVLGSPDLDEAPAGVDLECDEVTDERLPWAARSDVWRWNVLQRGGVYADTDVLFLRSLEPLLEGDHDAWITQDGGHAIPGGKRGWRVVNGRKSMVIDGLSIGVLAARRRSTFFARAHGLAAGVRASPDYQSHGTSLLTRHWRALSAGLSLGALPFRLFYSGSSAEDVRTLWKPGSPNPDAYALHWYGGSPESAPFLKVESAESLPDCPARRALLS